MALFCAKQLMARRSARAVDFIYKMVPKFMPGCNRRRFAPAYSMFTGTSAHRIQRASDRGIRLWGNRSEPGSATDSIVSVLRRTERAEQQIGRASCRERV